MTNCGPGSPHTPQASQGRASHPSCHHELEGRADLDLGLGLVLDCWKLLGWERSLGRAGGKEEPGARWKENLGEVKESRGRGQESRGKGQEELEEPQGKGQLQEPEDASPHMAPGT